MAAITNSSCRVSATAAEPCGLGCACSDDRDEGRAAQRLGLLTAAHTWCLARAVTRLCTCRSSGARLFVPRGKGARSPRSVLLLGLRRLRNSASSLPLHSRVYITSCPQLVKAAVRAADEGPGFDPEEPFEPRLI